MLITAKRTIWLRLCDVMQEKIMYFIYSQRVRNHFSATSAHPTSPPDTPPHHLRTQKPSPCPLPLARPAPPTRTECHQHPKICHRAATLVLLPPPTRAATAHEQCQNGLTEEAIDLIMRLARTVMAEFGIRGRFSGFFALETMPITSHTSSGLGQGGIS